MKVIIGRTERGRALIKSVDGLNLQDLSTASDEQIKAVTDLVWEIKSLYFSLVSGKASDVLGDLNIGGGTKLSASLVTDLTASIPRDVVVTAQKQWLPNLAAEMAKGAGASDRQPDGWGAVTADPAVAPAQPDAAGSADLEAASEPEAPQEPSKPDPPAADGEGGRSQDSQTRSAALHVARPRSVSGVQGTRGQVELQPIPKACKEAPSPPELSGAMRAGFADIAKLAEQKVAAGNAGAANAKSDGPQGKAADQIRRASLSNGGRAARDQCAEQGRRKVGLA